MSCCCVAALLSALLSPASTVPVPSTTVTKSALRPVTADDTRCRTPCSSFSDIVRPGCKFSTTAADALWSSSR